MLDATGFDDSVSSDFTPNFHENSNLDQFFGEAQDLNLVSQSLNNEYLSKETEISLAEAWKNNQCVESRNRLVSSHMRLAVKIAKKLKRNGYDMNDLMQDATLGLMRAAETFEPEKGYRFSTYARWWIKSHLQEAIMKGNCAVRLKFSTHNRAAFFTLGPNETEAENYLRRNGLEVTPQAVHEETARRMGVSSERLTEIKKIVPHVTSLNETMKDDEKEGGFEKINSLKCPNKTPEEEFISRSTKISATNIIAEAMSTLTDREKTIVRSRSMNLEPATLEMLANRFDITRERIRQIEINALAKIKNRLKRMGIDDLSILVED